MVVPSGITNLMRAGCTRLATATLQQQQILARHVHSSAAATSLQQQQVCPTSDLYRSGLLFSQMRPWKAVLVDAAGNAGVEFTGASNPWKMAQHPCCTYAWI